MHPLALKDSAIIRRSDPSGELWLKTICLAPHATVADAIACIDRSARVNIALVVDEQGRLLNTLSDGDVRRGLLANVALHDPIDRLLEIKARTPHAAPATAPAGTPPETLLELMLARSVRQLPLVDDVGSIVDVVALYELLPDDPTPLQAVVMAGGFGTRLRPLTEDLPKPMLPVAGKPLMEHIIAQLRQTGIRDINVTTHYRAEQIVSHFGNGDNFGVNISYVNEERPLGTGGALSLLERPSAPFLVINGDILTDIDFRAMHAYHNEHDALMTVAVRRYEIDVPYGVVECDGPYLRSLREKPQVGFFVNAGIYLLEPATYDYISAHEHMNMTDLITRLIDDNKTVVSFPVREYWLDIGRHDDYERAQRDILHLRARTAPNA